MKQFRRGPFFPSSDIFLLGIDCLKDCYRKHLTLKCPNIISEMQEFPDYYFLEDESVYSLIFSPLEIKDPINSIQKLYDNGEIGCFVAFVEQKDAEQVADLILRRLSKNTRAYILRVKFKEMVALYSLKMEIHQTRIQVFCPPKMIEGKFEIEEICIEL